MHLFIKKSLTFILFLILLLTVLYKLLDSKLNKTEDNVIYVWGDSQTYFGLNLYAFNDGKKALTGAQPGSGVYDFLVFQKKYQLIQQLLLEFQNHSS